MKGVEPARVSEVFDGEAEVVEEVLVGVGDAAVGSAHPDSLGIEIGENAVAGFAGDESFLVLFACGDVDGEAAEVSRNAIDHDGMTAAFEPEDLAVSSTHLKILHDHLAGFDATLNGGGDDGDVLGKNNLFEGAIVGDVGERMTEDGIRAGSIGDFAGGVFDVPCGDEGGLLDGGEEILLFLEDGVGLTAVGDVAEEQDNAVVEGAALDGEPKIRVRVEGFELARDTFIHGAMEMMQGFRRVEAATETPPRSFCREDRLWGSAAPWHDD